ncbi:MAG: Fic family protein [Candidatus Babeliales bacterium]
MKRQAGYYEKLGSINHFIPADLPPENPPFELTPQIAERYGAALQWLSKLDEAAGRLPNSSRFLKAYIIKEAMLTSDIEGIHTTLLDVYTQPLSGSKINKPTQLVLNYAKALEAALVMMKEQGLPIVNRVILRAHEILMTVGDSSKANPGHFRKQSVRVGQLIPPPAHMVPELMASLEKFINKQVETATTISPLIKAGLAHVQFETIHPFLDGNGRIGRLLIVLMFMEDNLLHTPILYPSYFFKKHQMAYYKHLDSVRTQGDFEGWVLFYLTAIEESSRDAYLRAKEIEKLYQQLHVIVQENSLFARKRDTAALALEQLFEYPVISIGHLADLMGKNYNTAHNIIKVFIELGWLTKQTKYSRNKLYSFTPYLEILEKELD